MLFSGRYYDHETSEEFIADGVMQLVSGRVYQLFPKPDGAGKTFGSKRTLKHRKTGARK